jgi:hypothetical protein
MTLTVFLYGLGVWAAMVPYFIGQGALRNFLLKPRVGELRAHQISSLTGSAAIIAAAWLFINSLHTFDYSVTGMSWLGVTWVGLTSLFEFGFGHYVMHRAWPELLNDYDVSQGRLWILVLATTFFALPLIAILVDA